MNVVTPFFIEKTMGKIKQAQSKQLAGITGQVAGILADNKQGIGIFIVFSEVVLFVGAYLVIKRVFLKNL